MMKMKMTISKLMMILRRLKPKNRKNKNQNQVAKRWMETTFSQMINQELSSKKKILPHKKQKNRRERSTLMTICLPQ